VSRLLDSMFFSEFIGERGPPWRPTDIWDHLYATLQTQLALELEEPSRIVPHLQVRVAIPNCPCQNQGLCICMFPKGLTHSLGNPFLVFYRNWLNSWHRMRVPTANRTCPSCSSPVVGIVVVVIGPLMAMPTGTITSPGDQIVSTMGPTTILLV